MCVHSHPLKNLAEKYRDNFTLVDGLLSEMLVRH